MGVQGANLAKTDVFNKFLETYMLGRVSPTRLQPSKFGRWRLPIWIPKGIQRWIPTGIQVPKEQGTGIGDWDWGLYCCAFHTPIGQQVGLASFRVPDSVLIHFPRHRVVGVAWGEGEPGDLLVIEMFQIYSHYGHYHNHWVLTNHFQHTFKV